MGRTGLPGLSVIIITPDRYDTVRKSIRSIIAQSVHERIELIIVAPAGASVRIDDPECSSLYDCRVIEVDRIESLGRAKAAGIRAAASPVIALIEEHVYPDPGWAAALIAAHRQPWAAVGPAVRNARPDNLVSWADFLITYGQWMEPLTDGAVTILPGHNSSYKRDILLAYGDDLGEMLEVEAIMHADLLQRGYTICSDPGAVIYHLGFSRLLPSLPVQFHIGRLFAADRAGKWPLTKRIVYTAGAPLIPLVRLFRLTRRLIRAGDRRTVPFAALPLALPGLSVSALGELAGYGFGPGASKTKMIRHEFHRTSHLPQHKDGRRHE
ncbi:glycosyltransferase [bacterium]|nr:glycosyltransferase [bacterium]